MVTLSASLPYPLPTRTPNLGHYWTCTLLSKSVFDKCNKSPFNFVFMNEDIPIEEPQSESEQRLEESALD